MTEPSTEQMRTWAQRCVALLGVVLAAGACGTRVEGEGRSLSPSASTFDRSASTAGAPAATDGTESGPGAGGGVAAPGHVESAPEPGRPTGSAAAPAAPTSRRRTAEGSAAPLRPAPAGTGDSRAAGETGASPAGAPARSTGSQSAPVPGQAVPAPPKDSAVIIASIGNYSGPAASTTLPILKGAQVWVQWINAHGGLNGFPVKFLTYDDGGDVARHRAQAQEAIERQGAVAFLAEVAPLTAHGTFDYLRQKRIPVIGTEGTQLVYEHPLYFPQGTSGFALMDAVMIGAAQQLAAQGKTTVGTITCVETPYCDQVRQRWADTAGQAGLKVTYQARSSFAQPDFTADCLGARNAGVDVFLILMDSNTIRRLAGACARQSYRPYFSAGAGILLDEFAREPNLQTMLGASNFFPYFKTDLPAIEEFAQALQAYGGGTLAGTGPETGWVAGKLLERAARALRTPTSQAILDGLYSIKNDDLGGLTNPITFTTGQEHAPVVTCWFNLKVQGKAWTTPDDYQRHCR